jgi:signal transduction histidine kinase
MSLPGTAVPLARHAAAELDAAVGNALDNVRSHAGPDARAFVLLEDLGDSVTVSVRDDGVGIGAGRLAEAEGQGRLGISKSIVGRMISLGGNAELRTEIDEGTEWELHVPRQNAKKGGP